MKQGELEGMPEPAPLRLLTADGQVLVTHGRTLVYRYEADDTGMRNLAIVALTDAGRRIEEVARLFGLTATYVSMLRGRARRGGSAALVRHRRGRPPKLTDRQVAQAQVWAGSGWTQQAIADQLKVARSVISELLARVGPAPVQDALTPTGNTDIESVRMTSPFGPTVMPLIWPHLLGGFWSGALRYLGEDVCGVRGPAASVRAGCWPGGGVLPWRCVPTAGLPSPGRSGQRDYGR